MPTVVTTFAELRNALENTDETHVFFGADIYGDDKGVQIPNTKSEVVIDGTYEGVRYKYRDYGNETTGLGLPAYTIRVSSPAGGTFRVTMQNMLIDSINYYGPMSGANAATDANVTLVMRNVEYHGPQTAYNRYGCMEYHDSSFTITNQYLYSEEFAECNRVIFGGDITISHHPTQSYSMFPFAVGNSATRAITVLSGANVTIDTGNSLFGLSPAFTIEDGASLTIITTKSLSATTTAYASPFQLGRDASFRCIQTARDGAISTLYCNSSFTVEEGASVYMEAQYDNPNELIEFTGSARSLILNNPKSFVLRSRAAGVVNFGASNRLEISGGQINYWNAVNGSVTPGGFDDIPAYSWRKTRLDDQTVPSAFIRGTTSNTAFQPDSGGTNLSAEELEGKALTNLLLYKACIFSVGDLPLHVNPITDDQYPVEGTTTPLADVRISYTSDAAYTKDGSADASGAFSIATDHVIPIATPVTVFSNAPFLLSQIELSAVDAGELTLNTPPSFIHFEIKKRLSGPPNIYGRTDDDWALSVSDTRVRSGAWTLLASIDAPLTSRTDPAHTLPGALVFVDAEGAAHPLGSTPMPIWSGDANGGTPLTTTIRFAQNRGLLMAAASNPFYISEEYRTPISWILRPADGGG